MIFRGVNTIAVDDEDFLYLGTSRGLTRVHLDYLHSTASWKNYVFADSDTTVNSIDIHGNIIAFATNKTAFYMELDQIDWETTEPIKPPEANIIDKAQFSDIKILENDGHIDFLAIYGAWQFGHSFYNPIHRYAPQDSLDTRIRGRSLSIRRMGQEKDIYINYGDYYGDFVTHPITRVYKIDGKLYATTWGDGLYQIDIGDAMHIGGAKPSIARFLPNCIHTNFVTKIQADRSNQIWFSDGVFGGATHLSGNGLSLLNNAGGNQTWTHIVRENDEGTIIKNNNVTAIAVDSQDRKYFGTWWDVDRNFGITCFDDTDPTDIRWWAMNDYSASVTSITPVDDYLLVTTQDRGVMILNPDLSIRTPLFPLQGLNGVVSSHKTAGQYFFGMVNTGVKIWNSSNMPSPVGPAPWINPLALSSGRVLSIDSYRGSDFEQVWFMVSDGIKMMQTRNGVSRWYLFNTDIKRREFDGSSWDNDRRQLYFIDEERMWGSDVATPTCLMIDPFGRVWIGSSEAGLTVYDIYEDRFYNYKTRNSFLPSDEILSLGYQSSTGKLFIGTRGGLVSVEIGKDVKETEVLGDDIIVFPNPFKPHIHEKVSIRVTDEVTFPRGKTECRIFDISGQLVATITENRYLDAFEWDGKNAAGKNCSSGVYFYMIKTEVGKTARGKIVLIR